MIEDLNQLYFQTSINVIFFNSRNKELITHPTMELDRDLDQGLDQGLDQSLDLG